jgi:hypothetical protein
MSGKFTSRRFSGNLPANAVQASEIDWGSGADQVNLDDIPDGTTSKLGQNCSTAGSPEFAGLKIGSLAGIILGTGGTFSAITNSSSNWDTAFTHVSQDGSSHSAVGLNTTHRSSNGSDHSYLDQSVVQTSTPTFGGLTIGSGSGIATLSTGVVGTITDSSSNWDAAYTHVSNNGSDHSYLDQSVAQAATPTFAGAVIGTLSGLIKGTSGTLSAVTDNSSNWDTAYTHAGSSGSDHSDVVTATSHITANGTSHTYINQDVQTTASPSFAGATIGSGSGLALLTSGVVSAVTDSRTNWDSAYTHVSSDGSDHGYVNQDVQTTASPAFANISTGGNITFTGGGSVVTDSAGDLTLAPNSTGVTNVKNIAWTVTTKTGAATLTQAEAGVILVSAGVGYTLTLPAASGNTGLTYTVIKTDDNANIITLDGNGAETINGAATYTALNAQYDYVTIVCDGSNWEVVNEVVAAGTVPASTTQYAILVGDGAAGWEENATFLANGGAISGITTIGMTGALSTATNVSMTGQLDMTGSGAFIDLNPAQTGTVDILNITPTAVLGTIDSEWKALSVDAAALDPSAAGVDIHGCFMDLSGVSLTNDPHLEGFHIIMPAAGAGLEHHAIHIGEGNIEHSFDSGTAAGSVYEIHEIEIDASGQDANSTTYAIDVIVEGALSGEVIALGTGVNVQPIKQRIETFTTPDQAGADSYAGRYASASYTAGIDTNEIFVADNDEIWLGQATNTFDELQVIMTTPATKDIGAQFYYYNTTQAWVEFFPTDGTEGFQQDGNIIWASAGFTNWDVNGDPAAGDGGAGYWIKIVRTRNADPGAPTPTTIKIASAVTNYGWDASGDLTINDATIAALSLTSMATNWTNAGRTVADAGILTTVDINGGSIDGVTIGAASAPTVTDLGSVATCDINGGTIDGITSLTVANNVDIGAFDLQAATLSADTLTQTRLVVVGADGLLSDATVVESSGALSGITTVSMSGNLTMTSGGSWISTANGNCTIQPNGTGQTIIYGGSTVVTAKSAAATLTIAEAGLVTAATAGGAFTLTLPTAVGNTGLKYSFIKIDAAANAVTLDGNGAQTINGAATYADMDAQWDSCTIISDGSNWLMAT